MSDLASLDVACAEVEKYGVHPDQFIEWYGPRDGRVLAVIHGGHFNGDGRLNYLRPAAFALGEAGFHVALIEYRQVERRPDITFEDISTLTRHPLLCDAIWLAHSTGTIFALGALLNPQTSVTHCVAVAPILDLRREVEEAENPAESTLAKWLGGSPSYIPDIYAEFDPAVLYARIGSADGFTSRKYKLDIIHGSADLTVPVQHTKDFQSEPFNIAIVPGANHNDVIRPGHDAWIFLLGALG